MEQMPRAKICRELRTGVGSLEIQESECVL